MNKLLNIITLPFRALKALGKFLAEDWEVIVQALVAVILLVVGLFFMYMSIIQIINPREYGRLACSFSPTNIISTKNILGGYTVIECSEYRQNE